MVGKIARGAYVFVVATMFVAWVISFNKEVPGHAADPVRRSGTSTRRRVVGRRRVLLTVGRT